MTVVNVSGSAVSIRDRAICDFFQKAESDLTRREAVFALLAS